MKANRTGTVAELKSWVVRNKGMASVSAVLAFAGLFVFITQQRHANERLRRNPLWNLSEIERYMAVLSP